MPEQFFLYYEELDWCDHFKRAGYEIWVDMQAVIYHKESISVGKNSMLQNLFHEPQPRVVHPPQRTVF